MMKAVNGRRGSLQLTMRLLQLASWFFFTSEMPFFYADCSDVPYEGAQNYWPLTKKTQAMTVVDVISSAQGYLHKATFIKNTAISGAVRFSGSLQWIDFPTVYFESGCIENPESCLFGFTAAFWIRFKKGKYIMATGAFTNSTRGTGLQITQQDGNYTFVVRTQAEMWQATVKAYLKTWCHIVVRWSYKQGLEIFMDGILGANDKTGKPEKIQPPSYSQTITIARPPRLSKNEFGKFEMAHLAIWLDHLTDSQVGQLGELVLQNSAASKNLCAKKSASCKRHPCSWTCHYGFPDAVCPRIKHESCKAIVKEIPTTVRSKTTHRATQPSTSKKTLTKDVTYFTPTAVYTVKPANEGPDQRVTTKKRIEYYDIDDIYMQAVHYLTLRNGVLIDMKGNSKVDLSQRPKVIRTTQIGNVIELSGHQDCVTIKDMKFRCIKDPALCEKTGFTVASWIRNHGDKKQYIAYSTDALKKAGPGFMIYHEENERNFTIQVRTRSKEWEAVIHRMPYHRRWWHLLITWNKQTGLSVYINGNFAIQKTYAEDVKGYGQRAIFPLEPEIDDMTVGCTNLSTGFIRSLKEFGAFDFGHLAIWSRVLKKAEIVNAFKASIIETRESLACCKQIAGHDCIALPCHKFEDPIICESLMGNDTCLCKEMHTIGKCQVETPLKNCENSGRYDCEKLTSQTGYCSYYQAEMEKSCPVSCHLCDGLYRNAAHYFQIHSNQLIDKFAKSKRAVFPAKLNVAKTSQLGDVIALNSLDYYVNMKGFQRECVTDLNVCASGLSIAFWLQMFDGKHIISGGRYRDEPRGSGFVILHDSNSSQFRIEVVTSRSKWVAIFHKVPVMKKWFHLVFTWSALTGIRVSINGQFVLQDAGATERKYILRGLYEDNGILIGGKDPTSGKIQNVNFKIGHLVVWDYALDAREIQLAYKESIKKTAASLKCCQELSAHKCVTNVCYKFRVPKLCSALFDQKKCLCQETLMSETCKLHAFKGECRDKRPDCKTLAEQNGYCENYQQEMEALCPLSCQFCYVSYSPSPRDASGRNDKKLDIDREKNKAETIDANLKSARPPPYNAMLLKIAMRNLSQEAEKFKSAETGSEKNGASNEDHSSHVSKFSKIKKNKSNEKEYNGNLHINLTVITSNQANGRKSSKLSKEVLVFALIGCAAGIILLFLISLYSWKVYRSKFTGAFIPNFKATSSIDEDEYGEEKWTKKYIDSSYFVIKDVPPKKRALPIIPIKPAQPKYQPPDFQ